MSFWPAMLTVDVLSPNKARPVKKGQPWWKFEACSLSVFTFLGEWRLSKMKARVISGVNLLLCLSTGVKMCRDSIAGQEYMGDIAITKDGVNCQRWDSQVVISRHDEGQYIPCNIHLALLCFVMLLLSWVDFCDPFELILFHRHIVKPPI